MPSKAIKWHNFRCMTYVSSNYNLRSNNATMKTIKLLFLTVVLSLCCSNISANCGIPAILGSFQDWICGANSPGKFAFWGKEIQRVQDHGIQNTSWSTCTSVDYIEYEVQYVFFGNLEAQTLSMEFQDTGEIHEFENTENTIWIARNRALNLADPEQGIFLCVQSETDQVHKIGYNSGAVLEYQVDTQQFFGNITDEVSESQMSIEQVEAVVEACETSTGIEDLPDHPLHIYPNPASDYIQLDQTTVDAVFRVYDLTGKVVLHGVTSTSRIDVSTLPSGRYFMEVISEANERFSNDLIVSH